ncbi:RNA-binding S4 domain-containing protein [Dongshaea marina]|uniref:RNA-binding S4 domain-containing protein n=1 Tax=Dongshaea marina TaxID=2047966 RepID=UPI000D3E3E0F|nr:RNA-binding S4 domain-containing protein [Dongshaea marina]
MSEDEFEVEAVGIEISSQPIELYKILKLADVVSGGGEAKQAISQGYVGVNGEQELRKRRKIYDGDLITFNGEFYLVICEQSPQDSPQQLPEQPAAMSREQKAPTKPAKSKVDKKKPSTGRKPIRF